MSNQKRPQTGFQSSLKGAKGVPPVTHTSISPSTIPIAQSSYGFISTQHQQYVPHFSYSHIPNIQNRIPLIGSIPPAIPGMYVPVAQGPRATPVPGIPISTGMIPQNIDPIKLLEQQKKFEKERNFQMQQQRLKQFTIAGKKGNINADNLIDSMFGHKDTSAPSKTKDSCETKKTVVTAVNSSTVGATFPNASCSLHAQPFPSEPITKSDSGTQFKQMKNDKKELDAMMLECSDLKGPQKANKFSKPVVKEITSATQQRSTFTASNKARDWRNVKAFDEIFVERKKPRFPDWCCKEKVADLYRKVEMVVTENNTRVPETNLLFPILMSSGLPQQLLAQIWDLVNQSAPGYLTVEEMYAALALIAVSQAGHVIKTTDILHQLPSCPIPQLQYFSYLVESSKEDKEPVQPTQPASVFSDSKEVIDSTTQKALRPNSISFKNDSLNSSNAIEKHSGPPSISSTGFTSSPDDDFDDFKSATPTCVNFVMHSPATSKVEEEDEFDEFKQAPVYNPDSNLSADKKVGTISTPTTTSHIEEQDLMSPEEDKYSIFRLIQDTDDSINWGDFNSNSSICKNNINAEALNATEEISKSNNIQYEPSLTVAQTDMTLFSVGIDEVRGKETKEEEDFGDFIHAEVKAPLVSEITSDFSNLNTDFADFANFSEKLPSVPVLNVSENSQTDDEFGEFTSSFPASSKVDLGQEFLFRHLKDNISLSESQSVSSLELGTYDGGGHSGDSKSSLSRQGSIPSLDLKSTGLETTEVDDGFGELHISSTLNRTSKTPSPAKDIKEIEHNGTNSLSLGSNYPISRNIPLADKYSVIRTEERKEDQYVSCWTRCLQSTVNVLQNTKKIFNQMSCSSICNEVLTSEEGRNYIKDIIEVYKVVCRIALSSKSISKETLCILDSIKEAEEAWNTVCGFIAGSPLMPQDSSFDFSSALLSTKGSDNTKACGLCLLNVNIKSYEGESLTLSYGGRNYHSTCANFWVNCVDPLLPALTLTYLL